MPSRSLGARRSRFCSHFVHICSPSFCALLCTFSSSQLDYFTTRKRLWDWHIIQICPLFVSEWATIVENAHHAGSQRSTRTLESVKLDTISPILASWSFGAIVLTQTTEFFGQCLQEHRENEKKSPKAALVTPIRSRPLSGQSLDGIHWSPPGSEGVEKKRIVLKTGEA